jgi:predicted GIY-YIG superfamily endonuclease
MKKKNKKTMPDFKQGKVYTIRCNTDDTLIYVGCTTQSLCERMAKHKYDSIRDPIRIYT